MCKCSGLYQMKQMGWKRSEAEWDLEFLSCSINQTDEFIAEADCGHYSTANKGEVWWLQALPPWDHRREDCGSQEIQASKWEGITDGTWMYWSADIPVREEGWNCRLSIVMRGGGSCHTHKFPCWIFTYRKVKQRSIQIWQEAWVPSCPHWSWQELQIQLHQDGICHESPVQYMMEPSE